MSVVMHLSRWLGVNFIKISMLQPASRVSLRHIKRKDNNRHALDKFPRRRNRRLGGLKAQVCWLRKYHPFYPAAIN